MNLQAMTSVMERLRKGDAHYVSHAPIEAPDPLHQIESLDVIFEGLISQAPIPILCGPEKGSPYMKCSPAPKSHGAETSI
jgi:hypothetical protein